VEKRHLQERLSAELLKTPPQGAMNVVFNGTPRMRLFQVQGEIVEPRRLDATTLIALREELPRVLQTYIDQTVLAVASEEPADRVGMAPAAVRGVTAIEDERFEFSWQDLGWVDPLAQPELQTLLLGVGEGAFAPVQSESDKASALFVAAERNLSAEEREQLELRARRASAQRRSESAVALFRDGVAQTQNVTYTF